MEILWNLPQLTKPPIPRQPDTPIRIHFVYPELGAATRYRIHHHIEQAHIAGFIAKGAAFDELYDAYNLIECDVLYIYRLGFIPRTLPLCIAAKLRHIPIIFDSDDFVWNRKEREFNFLDSHYSSKTVTDIIKNNQRIRTMMRWASAFIFSTSYLAQQAQQTFQQPAYVNDNALSERMIHLAQQTSVKQHSGDGAIVIGYFSGYAQVHNEDLASIGPALCTILDTYPHTILRIYGDVTLMGPLSHPSYATRVEQCGAVDWQDLPKHIAQVDINIAPLIDNPYRRSKSAIKYLEAAIVKVPTIASRLDPYHHTISHGATGMLAMTIDEWTENLTYLINNAEARQLLGMAAYENACLYHTTGVRAKNFASIISEVAR
ncbi:MAG: glycosyltransferase [Chloroflexota bacterium]